MPTAPEGTGSAGSRLLIAVHLPSGTAQACGFARGYWRHAAREPRSAILTPSTACGSADADRWTVSPRAIAASISASSTWLSSSISRSSAAIRAARSALARTYAHVPRSEPHNNRR